MQCSPQTIYNIYTECANYQLKHTFKNSRSHSPFLHLWVCLYHDAVPFSGEPTFLFIMVVLVSCYRMHAGGGGIHSCVDNNQKLYIILFIYIFRGNLCKVCWIVCCFVCWNLHNRLNHHKYFIEKYSVTLCTLYRDKLYLENPD